MPTVILNPDSPSAWGSSWNLTGAATEWEALSDASSSSYVFSNLDTDFAGVHFESLPVDADTVTSVTMWVDVGQESGGTNQAIVDLVSVNENNVESPPFTPSDGARTSVSWTFPITPDGGSWTVASVNEILIGRIKNYTGTVLTASTICEKMWLEVVYTTAAVDPPLPYLEVAFPATDSKTVSFGDQPEVTFHSNEGTTISFGDVPEVAFAGTEVPVIDMTRETA